MAKEQTLRTNIVINAKTGPGFSEVGNTLTELGAMVDGLSQHLISFGEDSVKVYRDYQKSMKDAEVALSTVYGRGTKELNQVMRDLDTSATTWAASTIFHTNDVANAISEAAHAGWDYQKILAGIPAAMQLAQAGGLDLSEAVNYIVKSTNAAGIGFEDMTEFIDLWTYAANSSASDIREFGDAMLRMGSTMRFSENTEELMTLLAVTANAGSVGSEAGTLIRNSIIRLIAPTKKADEAMSELGATYEETAEIMNDEALAAANAELAARGFSAFNEDGELKSVLDTYRELYVALGDIAGGYENIDRNESALKILSAIFPTRTITEALTLIRAASEGYDGLYESMMGGDATGYGAYAAETMMDTLDGKIETFGSKVERLKQLTGAELSGQVINLLDFMGGIVDSISEMDEDKFGALVSGLEVIAGAGPGLIAAGTAFRFMGSLFTPAGAMGMAAVALGAFTTYVNELNKADFAKGFGLAELDHSAIRAVTGEIASGFEEAYKNVNSFRDAMNQSMTTYQTASQTLSGTLLTDLITGAKLTETDKNNLLNLGTEMQNAVIEGMKNSQQGSLTYFSMLFGDSDSKQYQDILSVTNGAFEESIAEAESIGQQIRDAMTSAFSDGQISEDEYSNILSYMQSYNQAISRASSEAKGEQDYINQQMLLHRAQTASLEEITGLTEEVTAERDRILSEAEDTYLRERYGLEYRYNQAIEKGGKINGVKATEARRDRALSAMEEAYNRQRLGYSSQYDSILSQLWTSQINQSEYGSAYDFLGLLAGDVLAGGQSPESAISTLNTTFGNNRYAGQVDLFGNNTRTRLGELLAREIQALGGYESIFDKINQYSNIGDETSANQLRMLYTMQQLNDEYSLTGVNKNIFGNDVVQQTSYASDYGGISVQTSGRAELDAMIAELQSNPITVPIIPHIEGQDSVEALKEQGVSVEVEADTQKLEATIDGEDGQTLMQYVDGDATNLEMSITDQDGRTLVEYVTGDASSLANIINSYSGKTITVNIAGRKMFAEGGRATEASIFGEAGPEWAIPEEHSLRTANLLTAAAMASGFTWPELLSSSSGNTSTFVYSPTIIANDASGVEQKLQEDKRRLEGWYESRERVNKMEVYA